MKTIKISEATDAALDWAVAMCEGFTEYDPSTEKMLPPRKEHGWVPLSDYNYSTDWSQGGPIVERERIAVWFSKEDWKSQMRDTSAKKHGPTPLIAAMRCFVASKLGEEVNVPEELL